MVETGEIDLLSSDATAVILVNTGSPDRPDSASVRKYLRQFLSDPRVMDAPYLIRMMVLHLFILPFRPSRSAKKYRSIWTKEGSPLLIHTRDLADGLRRKFAEENRSAYVSFAMRYGNPGMEKTIRSILEQRSIQTILLVPLFPQYAEATTGSILDQAQSILKKLKSPVALEVIPSFYSHPEFVDGISSHVEQYYKDQDRPFPETMLFTYHGLPERQIQKADPSGSCLTEDCCNRLTDQNKHCYRAQCFETSRLIASRLGLDGNRIRVSFQSRMGRIPWIGPHTDEVLAELGKNHANRVSDQKTHQERNPSIGVIAPSFVADCLETLEEIAMEGTKTYQMHGGESMDYIPALNSSPAWVDGLYRMLQEWGKSRQNDL